MSERERERGREDLLLRKREDPEHINLPSAMIAILSPSRSASSLTETPSHETLSTQHTHSLSTEERAHMK